MSTCGPFYRLLKWFSQSVYISMLLSSLMWLSCLEIHQWSLYVYHFFMLLRSMMFCRSSIICLFLCLFIYTWVISSFWPFQIKLLQIFETRSSYMFILLIVTAPNQVQLVCRWQPKDNSGKMCFRRNFTASRQVRTHGGSLPKAVCLRTKDQISLFKKIVFLERREREEKGRETSMCGCFSRAPYWGPG